MAASSNGPAANGNGSELRQRKAAPAGNAPSEEGRKADERLDKHETYALPCHCPCRASELTTRWRSDTSLAVRSA